MLNGHAAYSQLGGVFVQALLDPFQHIFVFPSATAPLLAVGSFVFDDTAPTMAGPVRPDRFAILLAREPVDQLLTSGADKGVSLRVIGEVSFVELPARASI